MASTVSIVVLINLYFLLAGTISQEPGYYVSTERMNLTYFNPEYFAFFDATSSRPGRWDYKYYVHFHIRTLKTLGNNMKMDVYFYEFLSNEYRRGMVEMHVGLCDLIMKDPIFGPALRTNLPVCPVPPGEYHMRNMSIPDLPLLRTFPFRKGRIYMNGSVSDVLAGAGYIDMEIKRKPVRKTKPSNATKTAFF